MHSRARSAGWRALLSSLLAAHGRCVACSSPCSACSPITRTSKRGGGARRLLCAPPGHGCVSDILVCSALPFVVAACCCALAGRPACVSRALLAPQLEPSMLRTTPRGRAAAQLCSAAAAARVRIDDVGEASSCLPCMRACMQPVSLHCPLGAASLWRALDASARARECVCSPARLLLHAAITLPVSTARTVFNCFCLAHDAFAR